MAETLLQYHKPVIAPSGVEYIARACGSPIPGGRWQGWIEFTPASGGAPVRTDRETTQPNRNDAAYWATGVSRVYLEGALRRALSRLTVNVRLRLERPTSSPARFTAGAGERAVLDPFPLYRQGEPVLRRQLSLLAQVDLVTIATTYDLTSVDCAVLIRLPAATANWIICSAFEAMVNPSLPT